MKLCTSFEIISKINSNLIKFSFQTLIEANVDVKTTDGYLLRVFCIGFTNKDQMSQKKTCYAQHTQVRAIRKKMIEIITKEVTDSDLKDVVQKLLPDSIAKEIEKNCQGIYPLHDVYIRKVNVLYLWISFYKEPNNLVEFKINILKSPKLLEE